MIFTIGAEVLIPILLVALMASASPGPATLAIAQASMDGGARRGLLFAAGVIVGSWSWSFAAAAGLGTIMAANAWVFEVMRYVGAGYLAWLGYKAARRAISGSMPVAKADVATSFTKGLALHLTNPKAILFFGALYTVGVPAGAGWADFMLIGVAVGLLSVCVFTGYAVLFSRAPIVRAYTRMHRWFDGVFAVFFGLTAAKIFTTRITG